MNIRRFAWLGIIGPVLALSACAADPWVDARRDAARPGQIVGQSTRDRVAICHAPNETPEALLRLAVEECARTERAPEYVGTVKWQCTLTAPHRSFFACR